MCRSGSAECIFPPRPPPRPPDPRLPGPTRRPPDPCLPGPPRRPPHPASQPRPARLPPPPAPPLPSPPPRPAGLPTPAAPLLPSPHPRVPHLQESPAMSTRPIGAAVRQRAARFGIAAAALTLGLTALPGLAPMAQAAVVEPGDLQIQEIYG